jgi:hypothetical protein
LVWHRGISTIMLNWRAHDLNSLVDFRHLEKGPKDGTGVQRLMPSGLHFLAQNPLGNPAVEGAQTLASPHVLIEELTY